MSRRSKADSRSPATIPSFPGFAPNAGERPMTSSRNSCAIAPALHTGMNLYLPLVDDRGMATRPNGMIEPYGTPGGREPAMADKTPTFEIENLHVSIEDKEILKGVDLTVNKGEVHAVMGPNGSGKSTMAYVIAGHPAYEVTEGAIRFNGEDILEWEPDERARKGLFLAFQYPTVIPGVSMANFLRMAVTNVRNARAEDIVAAGGTAEKMTPREFRKLMREKMSVLKMDDSFATRYLNEGFSGGEKKRAEILQMALLEPSMAVLDETDSGLDIDALKVVSEGVNALAGPEMGMLVITHYQRLLNHIKPHFVHIMMDGRIVQEGGPELAHELEAKGYETLRAEVSAASH